MTYECAGVSRAEPGRENKKNRVRPPDQLPARMRDGDANLEIENKLDVDRLAKEIDGYTQEFRESEVVAALARLVLEIRDEIPNYDLIISDDASGRLVSLFLKRVIDKKRKEEEEKEIDINFVASGQHSIDRVYQAINDLIEQKVKKIKAKKLLLVTECIGGGEYVNIMTSILDELNLDYDVAALSTETLPQELDFDFKRRLKYGMAGRSGNAFYKNLASGVFKDKEALNNPSGGRVSPHPSKRTGNTPREKKELAQDVRGVRKGLFKIADEMAEKLLD